MIAKVRRGAGTACSPERLHAGVPGTAATGSSRAGTFVIRASLANILHIHDQQRKLFADEAGVDRIVQVNRKAAVKMLQGVPAVEELP
jgi:hypothetical protein